MSTYSSAYSYPRGYYGSYGAPSNAMSQPYYTSYTPSAAYSNYSYAPSAAYSNYSSGYNTGVPSDRTYFSLNGKLVRSYKVRSYRRAQKHVLDLFPDLLQGVASSRIQFYVIRNGYRRGRYQGLKSYISKSAWPSEMDNLAEHETVGIEIRPSVSFAESVASFFNRSRVM